MSKEMIDLAGLEYEFLYALHLLLAQIRAKVMRQYLRNVELQVSPEDNSLILGLDYLRIDSYLLQHIQWIVRSLHQLDQRVNRVLLLIEIKLLTEIIRF